MRHTQKALQTDTAVLLEKLLHMFTSSVYNSTLLAKFILRAGEQRIRHILIHQDILCRVPHLCTFSNTLSATASHSSGVHRNERVPKDARNVA